MKSDSEDGGLGSWGLELRISKLKNQHLSTRNQEFWLGRWVKIGPEHVREMLRLGSQGQMHLRKTSAEAIWEGALGEKHPESSYSSVFCSK